MSAVQQRRRTTNSQRLQYTLTRDAPNAPQYARLASSRFYLSKQTRLESRVRVNERQVLHLMRVVLYLHVFGAAALPADSISEIVARGELLEHRAPASMPRDIDISEARRVIDRLLGRGFCRVAQYSFARLWREYLCSWRYRAYGARVLALSAADIVNLHRFVNVRACEYTAPTRFVLDGSRDHRVLLQNKVKDLTL